MPEKRYRNSKLHADRVLESASKEDPLKTAIVHPVKATALKAAKEAYEADLILPTLVGPKHKIIAAAEAAEIDISKWDVVDAPHSHAAGDIAAKMAGEGTFEAVMKGSLHSDEILKSVITEPLLQTERRISHIYAMDVKTYHKSFLMTDAAINVAPDLKTKVDIVQNAVNLWHALHDADEVPRVAVLAAVEGVNPKMQATIDAACLCKMADRNQLEGKMIIDGPLAFDNAISSDAAEQKGIVSDVAGNPDIMLAPDIEAGNIMCKQLTFMAEAEAAGLVLGARVPVILTSRADSVRSRLLSCALAVKMAVARREGRVK